MWWLKNILIAIDQLGNAISGGNPDNTISATTGYMANFSNSPYKVFWKILEKIIDFTFYPMDGKGHCISSYDMEAMHRHDFGNGSVVGKILLAILVITGCTILILPIRIIALIF